MPQDNSICISRLILIPSLITLGVTILRLVGELLHWPKPFFNAAPGGGAAIVGISWLPVIFGIYFALKLAGAGEGPTSLGKAIGLAVLGLVVFAGGVILVGASQFKSAAMWFGGIVLIAASVAVAFPAWRSLTKALVAYGYLARIPVLIVMFFALRGNWGTHYDGLPPNFPEMSFWPKFLAFAVLPQMILWVAFTVIAGLLFGGVAVAIFKRGKAAAPATP